MVPPRNALLLVLCTCESLLKSVDSWGINILGPAPDETCKAGDKCSEDTQSSRRRGVTSRPAPEGETRQSTGWPWDFSWLVRISIRMINDAATTSLEYCGTLCASIGLAAKWSYWLATALVAIFLLQLLVWTFNWVLMPGYKHLSTVWRYLRGQGQWYEVAHMHGVQVFRPKWVGPRGREEMSAG